MQLVLKTCWTGTSKEKSFLPNITLSRTGNWLHNTVKSCTCFQFAKSMFNQNGEHLIYCIIRVRHADTCRVVLLFYPCSLCGMSNVVFRCIGSQIIKNRNVDYGKQLQLENFLSVDSAFLLLVYLFLWVHFRIVPQVFVNTRF